MWHAVCCTLENRTDAHDCCSDEDSLLSTEIIAEDESRNGAKETANIVDCLNRKGSCQLSVPGVVWRLLPQVSYRDSRFHADVVADVECIQKVISNDNTAKHALIVAELGTSC